jgi:hypothetical protein
MKPWACPLRSAKTGAAPSADMRIALAIALTAALAGCAGSQPVTPSSRLIGPPEWAMTPAKELPQLQAGDDAKVSLGQCWATPTPSCRFCRTTCAA